MKYWSVVFARNRSGVDSCRGSLLRQGAPFRGNIPQDLVPARERKRQLANGAREALLVHLGQVRPEFGWMAIPSRRSAWLLSRRPAKPRKGRPDCSRKSVNRKPLCRHMRGTEGDTESTPKSCFDQRSKRSPN